MATIPDSLMSPASAATPVAVLASNPSGLRTVAEVLKICEGIAPERIRLNPIPGTATEVDVQALHDSEKRLFELADGILIEKTMGYLESRLAAMLIQILGTYCEDHDLGLVAAPDGMLRLRPDLIRIPDVSFVSWSKLKNKEVPLEPIPDLVPDLAIEVLSKSNSHAEMQRKLHDYFEVGVMLVWYVDPTDRSIHVYSSPEQKDILSENDMLDGGKVLPGFTIKIGDIFTRAGMGKKPKKL